MGGACSSHGINGKCIQFWSKDNVRMNPTEIGWESEDWMHLTQVRNQWKSLVNMV